MLVYLEVAEKLIVPLLLAYLVYLFGNRTKKVEVDIEKIKELNVVLSDMLNSWYYLNKLSETLAIYEEKDVELIFPKEFLPFIALRSGLLDDKCFTDLDESIRMLKQYDAVSYYELEGIGSRYNYLRTNYTLPFIQSKNTTEFGLNINRQFLDKLLNEIEEHLRSTSKQISKDMYKRVESKIEMLQSNAALENIRGLNEEFYELIIGIMPTDIEKPTYEDFIKGFGESEIQESLRQQFELMATAGIAEVTALIMSDSSLSLEEVEQRLGNSNR